MNDLLLAPVLGPILLGTVCFLLPRKIRFVREAIALLGTAATLGLTIWLFLQKPLDWFFNQLSILRLDDLSAFILLAIGVFGFLITLYSMKYLSGKKNNATYYSSLLWTLGIGSGVVLSNHLLILLFWWGFLGITLYLLILAGGENAAPSAKKALIIIGGSDALILLGIGFIYALEGSFEMNRFVIPFTGPLAYSAFILLLIGVFAKIGVFPLHTWIPDMAEKAPLSVSAFLPGSLDKLLGVYLLARMCLELFQTSEAMNLLLLIAGSLTVIVSAMMGLIQNDGKKLLGYLVVIGAGYMAIGFGTGNPIGRAGGLFYMINSALWTCCLFLCLGCVEYRTGKTHLKKLGGLVRSMPVTFLIAMVAMLSISGIPPFNGFVSKWMIYQGLLEMGGYGNPLWILWLVIAMFGSVFTLAVGMKMIHSIFLGNQSKDLKPGSLREASFFMILPMSVLALFCVVFGIFARSIPLKYFISPVIPDASSIGLLSQGLATTLVLIGLAIGFIIYLFGKIKVREAEPFLGGEHLPAEERVTGAGFFDSIRDIDGLSRLYRWAVAKYFDIYDQGGRLATGISKMFRRVHTGVVNTYMLWVIVSLTILLVIIMCAK
jgi:formate hydrogenlyase subunit 3/multisubunit Na+/H+ antiporter MnhD subunit